MNSLTAFGWNETLDNTWRQLAPADTIPGRIVADFGTSLRVATPDIITAELSGKLAHYSSRDSAPKVGDWVAVSISPHGHAVIEWAMPRRSEIARKATGKRSLKQTLAANVDVAFVLLAVDGDFSLERLRRFLFQLSVNDIAPVIVLNKADKTDDLEAFLSQVRPFGLPVVTTIASEGIGVSDLLQHIQPGKTAVLLGSSGVGKSTLTNRLLGRDQQAVSEVHQSDETGRHTTVHRELFLLPQGGLLIDTPGIRELQLWGTEDNLDGTFEDIINLARRCRFTTCRHVDEAGCAIQHALKEHQLAPEKYAAFVTMKRELGHTEERRRVHGKRSNAKSKRSIAKAEKDLIQEMREDSFQ